MTSSDRIDALLESTDLSQLAADPTISEFWKRQIQAARDRAADGRDGALRLGDIVRSLGYGFRMLPPDTSLRKDPELTAVLKTRRFQTLPALTAVRGTDLSKDQWEHLCAVGVLEDFGLLDSYLDFIKPFGIRSDMSTARHYYYLTVIQSLVQPTLAGRPLHVLEIGAGAGNLAVFLLSLGVVSTYVIVDLPEMLLNAALQIRTFSKRAQVSLGEPPDHDGTPKAPRVYLVRTEEIARAARNRFTLALNFNSFMEMDQPTRDFYIREIYRTAADGAVFYNVNRRQAALPQPDGSPFDNNPLLYPYDPDDDVMFWEDDPFQTAARAWFAARPSLAVARAARMRRASGVRGWLRRLGAERHG